MKVESINYSLLKQVEYQGKTIATGIFKTPSQEPVAVGYSGLEGDAQADLINHGGAHKAVYAFAADHYPYWRKKLDNQQLAFGAFGENLTISGLFESNIYIGDRWRIGDCVLEVSQPRVPCFKLGIALNNKQAAKLFTASYNTGVYFRVLEPGTIAPGQSAEKISRLSNSVSVAELFRAKFDKTYASRDEVFAMARNISQLAPEWQAKVQGKTNK